MKKTKKCQMNEDEKRQKIVAALHRKRECERKALGIVDRLSEECLSPEELISVAAKINQGYYDDIVTERSITKMCGYPTCSNKILHVSTAKFHISLRDKRVYDTEDRQKFCSGFCYKASNFLRAQLDTSPLWLRETSLPPVTLFQQNSPASLGLSGKGEIIDLMGRAPLPPEGDLDRHVVIVENNDDGINIRNFEEDSAADSTIRRKQPDPKSILKKPTQSHKSSKGVESKIQSYIGLQETVVEKQLKTLNICDTSDQTVQSQPQEVHEPPRVLIERVLGEWFTSETLKLLRSPGAEDDDEDEDEDIEHEVGVSAAPDSDLAPKFFLDPEAARETEMFKSKFSAFLQGKEVFEANLDVKEKEIKDSTGEPRLPLLDRHAQSQLRIRIVLDQLSRHSTDVLALLSLPSRLALEEMRRIVRTLKLSPNNITLKPVEWTLVAVTLMTMAARRNEDVRSKLESDSGKKCLDVLLQQFQVSRSFPEKLLTKLEKNLDKMP